jgi:hypothetical protein
MPATEDVVADADTDAGEEVSTEQSEDESRRYGQQDLEEPC